MVESMVALTLVDALMQQKAQCELFNDLRIESLENGNEEHVLKSAINPLGKKL